jgi:general secretion pathway protein B
VPAPTAAPAAPGAVTGTAGAAVNAPASTSPLGSSTAPAATGQPGPVLSFAELSPEDRARLPAVNVSGSTYSQNPGLRMLIVNGRVVQEGQDIAPGLRLETIGPRNAVLNHQGLRYSIGY